MIKKIFGTVAGAVVLTVAGKMVSDATRRVFTCELPAENTVVEEV